MSDVHVEIFSGAWFCGWLFTWGYLGLTGIKIFYAAFIWAYYLGQALGGLA